MLVCIYSYDLRVELHSTLFLVLVFRKSFSSSINQQGAITWAAWLSLSPSLPLSLSPSLPPSLPLSLSPSLSPSLPPSLSPSLSPSIPSYTFNIQNKC